MGPAIDTDDRRNLFNMLISAPLHDFESIFPTSSAPIIWNSPSYFAEGTLNGIIPAHANRVNRPSAFQTATGLKCEPEISHAADIWQDDEACRTRANKSTFDKNTTDSNRHDIFFPSSANFRYRGTSTQETVVSRKTGQKRLSSAQNPLVELSGINRSLETSLARHPSISSTAKTCTKSPDLQEISAPSAAVPSRGISPACYTSKTSDDASTHVVSNYGAEQKTKIPLSRQMQAVESERREKLSHTGISKRPSKYCHLCIRKTRQGAWHLPCSTKGCRKTVCVVCIEFVYWRGKSNTAVAFQCPHCLGVCEDITDRIPQCEHYKRAARRRKRRRTLERHSSLLVYTKESGDLQTILGSALTQDAGAEFASADPLQLSHGHHTHIQSVRFEERLLESSDYHALTSQSSIASGTPLDPERLEVQNIVADTSNLAEIAEHTSAIDTAIATKTGALSIQNSSPIHSVPFAPIQIFSELGSHRHIPEAIDVPAILKSIDGALDGIVRSSIEGPLQEDVKSDQIDLPHIDSRFMMNV